MSTNVFSKLPGVLSFQRLFVISDAVFWNLHANGSESELQVVRHGIRGTQNTAQGAKDVNNIQITDTAKTAADARGFASTFSFSSLPLSKTIFACAGTDARAMSEAIAHYVESAVGSDGLAEISRRYARNVLNGRWLFRNLILGRSIKLKVEVDGEERIVIEDVARSDRKTFENYSEEEKLFGSLIQSGFEGGKVHTFTIRAEVDFGFTGAVEVFPSQNYVENKPKGFARPLYKVNQPSYRRAESVMDLQDVRPVGQAALRDQKVGNALRTIDTWFSDYAQYGQPIAVEPQGASLDAQRFFREKKDTSFSILKQIGSINPSSDEGMFLLAALIRGGVYSESEKKTGE